MTSNDSSRSESGQAMIFFAILASTMMLTLGLAVEGGRMFVTFRQMQSAADMAALVGAQSLPSASQASADALQYAQENGFSSSQTTVCIPPKVISPYSVINYTASGNAPCSNQNDHYIEVQITDNLGTVPIFNIPVSLSAHAVARKGIPDLVDYALVSLDPTATNGIKFNNNNGVILNGSAIANSTSSSSTSGALTTPGGGTSTTCNGAWNVVASEADPGNLVSYAQGTVSMAPPGCSSGSGADSPDRFIGGAGAIPDPYGSTVPPSSTTLTNCTYCAQTAHYLDRNGSGSSAWHLASEANSPHLTNGSSIELFPGVYPNGIQMSGGTLYLNPGVYTLQSDFKVTGGTICIFGAPACDIATNAYGNGSIIPGTTGANCGNANFVQSGLSTSVSPSTWYYYCSPWGIWDSSSFSAYGGRPGDLPTTGPTFIDPTTGSNSTTPLNGVTIYMQSGSINIQGGGALSLAFPNPCSSSNTATWAAGTTQVPFPSGQSTAIYPYPPGSIASTISSSSSPAGQVYPNADLTKAGDCTNPGVVWQNEFGGTSITNQEGQHLNFLFFAQNTSTSLSLQGSGPDNWWGIIHTFPCASSPCTLPPTSACAACSVSIAGNAGGSNGPAMLFGQIISDSMSFSGTSLVQVFNRPGGQNMGPGTSLIE